MDGPAPITEEIVEKTVHQVQSLPDDDLVELNMERISVQVSATRSKPVFCCKICSFQTKYQIVCKTHVTNCLNLVLHSKEAALNTADDGSSSSSMFSKRQQPVSTFLRKRRMIKLLMTNSGITRTPSSSWILSFVLQLLSKGLEMVWASS